MTMVVQQGFAAYNARKTHRDDMEARSRTARELADQYRAENEKLRYQTELEAAKVRLLVEQRQMQLATEQNTQLETMRGFFTRQHLEQLASKKETERMQAEVNSTLDRKMDQIHVLVNSNMTAAMERELYALQANLILLNETIALKVSMGLGQTRVLRPELSEPVPVCGD